jgi:4-hydroxy-3-methylbut-2-en-1-yl diphosphate reductase
VSYAIDIVELVLERHGPPVYVRHEIVHNRHVVDKLRAAGAIFVDELADVPAGSLVIFSAHGVAPSVRAEAKQRGLRVIDATCPLVTKVHLEALRYARDGYEILVIGHRGHVEVIGTLGHAPDRMHLVETVDDVARVALRDPERVAVVTQTTLSVDDTCEIVEAVRRRFPSVRLPAKDDICYATQNRQAAVKQLARDVDLVLVLGAANSSNANRLREVAEALGTRARLINDVRDIRPEWLDGCARIGVTAGASTPEFLVREVVDYLGTRCAAAVREFRVVEEDVRFGLPHELLEIARQKQAASAAAS